MNNAGSETPSARISMAEGLRMIFLHRIKIEKRRRCENSETKGNWVLVSGNSGQTSSEVC